MPQDKSFSFSDYFFFLVPSLIGLVCFLLPLPFEGGYDLLVGKVAKTFLDSWSSFLPLILLVFLCVTSLLSFLAVFYAGSKGRKGRFFLHFRVSHFWLLVRVLGFVFACFCYFKVGPFIFWDKETGSTVFYELLPFLFCIFLCAGFLLPLLLNFGLLEFFGVLLTKVMRPLFTLPGRSSLDCLSSVIGDGSIGILLTNKQYEEGFYSRREAMVIATTFSFVSITFSFVVLSHAKLSFLVFPFFVTIAIAAFVAAVVCPRIPPLSLVEDTYLKKRKTEGEEVREEGSLFFHALYGGVALAKKNASLSRFLKEACTSVLDMWFGVLPAVMCFGTISLVIAQYTPLFKYLGLVFYPLLLLLQVPEAYEASQAFIIGFSDMFLPVIVSQGIESDYTRFVIACTSVSQLIFMSEVGALLLSSKIGIRFRDLVAIFFVRTLVTLPVIVLCARFFLQSS